MSTIDMTQIVGLSVAWFAYAVTVGGLAFGATYLFSVFRGVSLTD